MPNNKQTSVKPDDLPTPFKRRQKNWVNKAPFQKGAYDNKKLILKGEKNMSKTKNLSILIVVSTILIFSIIGFVACNPATESSSTTITTIEIEIDQRINGKFDSDNTSIAINDGKITIENKSTPSANTIIYEIASIDYDSGKIVVKDPDNSSKTIDIIFNFNGDSFSLTIGNNPPIVTTRLTGLILYVSTTGDDKNEGSASKPLKTIQRAVNLANYSEDTIYVAKGTYNELVNIVSIIPMTIKGGYTISGSDWTRANINERSIITKKVGGDGALPDGTGRITISENSKVILENIDIKGGAISSSTDDYVNPPKHYTEIYGIVNFGDLTIDNCDIVAMESGNIYNLTASGNIVGSNSGIRNNGGKLTILSGRMIGAAGNANVKWSHGVTSFDGAVTIIDGTITGITENATAEEWADGFEIWGVTLNNTGGIITGTTGNATAGSSGGIDIHNGGNINISGGTITGLTGNAKSDWVCGVNYDPSNDSKDAIPLDLVISGGIIIGSNGRDTKWGAYGVKSQKGTITISGGTIVGIEDGNVISGDVRGIEIDRTADITISGGTIIGIKNGNVNNPTYDTVGVNSGGKIINISGGTIIGANGNGNLNKDVYGAQTWGGGTLTISNGTITGITDNVMTNGYYVVGVRSWDGDINILGGTITGASGSVKVKNRLCGVLDSGGSNVTISNGTITGATTGVTDNIVVANGDENGIVGITSWNKDSLINISGGIIIGASGNVKVVEGLTAGFEGISNTNISGGTIIANTGNVDSGWNVGINSGGIVNITGGIITGVVNNSIARNGIGVCHLDTNAITTISSCEIYGGQETRDSTALNGAGKFKKGSGNPAIIENNKGDGSDIWNTFDWNL